MLHKCNSKKPTKPTLLCRFSWASGLWCAKVIRCPDCGQKVHPYNFCSAPEKCEYFKPNRWFTIPQWWRNLEALKYTQNV